MSTVDSIQSTPANAPASPPPSLPALFPEEYILALVTLRGAHALATSPRCADHPSLPKITALLLEARDHLTLAAQRNPTRVYTVYLDCALARHAIAAAIALLPISYTTDPSLWFWQSWTA